MTWRHKRRWTAFWDQNAHILVEPPPTEVMRRRRRLQLSAYASFFFTERELLVTVCFSSVCGYAYKRIIYREILGVPNPTSIRLFVKIK